MIHTPTACKHALHLALITLDDLADKAALIGGWPLTSHAHRLNSAGPGIDAILVEYVIAIYPLLVIPLVMVMLRVVLMLPVRGGRGIVHGLASK